MNIELHRHDDGQIYRFLPCEPEGGKPAWQREDGTVWILFLANHGWVAVDQERRIGGIPWGVAIADQGSLPPAGAWVSKKGSKSYVYDLLLIDTL